MKKRKGGELYMEVARVVVEALKEAGVPPAAIVKLATSVTASIYRNFSGGVIYFPLNAAEQQARRAAEIVAAFDGGNYRALALKHDLSEVQVRGIVRRSAVERFKDRRSYKGGGE